MRKSLYLLMIAGFFLCLSALLAQGRPLPHAAGEHAADREAVRAVLRAQQSAWNRADVDAFLGKRIPSLAVWSERERVICARYAAVQVDRRLQANLDLAASLRSC